MTIEEFKESLKQLPTYKAYVNHVKSGQKSNAFLRAMISAKALANDKFMRDMRSVSSELLADEMDKILRNEILSETIETGKGAKSNGKSKNHKTV